jgi:DNA-binding transcriptional ArsR family regulator
MSGGEADFVHFFAPLSKVVTFASGAPHHGCVTDSRGKAMDMISVSNEATRRSRMADFAALDRDQVAEDEAAKRSNREFVQVYPKGWKRLQVLIRTNPSAARVYAFLAEHIDGVAGAVVVSQEVIAKELDVHERTVRRLTGQLEEAGALVRIKVGTGVYAYALDPGEVWRSWDDKKECAAFVTRTLVLKSDRANAQVRRKLKVMLGEPELPLGA